MLQILLEGNFLTVSFLHARIAREYFECWTETCKYCVSPDDALLREPGHPLVNAARQFLKYITPITNVPRTKCPVSTLPWAAYQMNR